MSPVLPPIDQDPAPRRIAVGTVLMWAPLYLSLLGYCVHPVNDLLRMMPQTPAWLVALGGHTTKFVFVPVVLLCTWGVLRHRRLRLGALPSLWFAILAIAVCFAFIQGVWSVGTGRNAIRYFVSHLGMASLMAMTTLHYATGGIAGDHWLRPEALNRLARFCLVYFAVTYAIGFAFVRSGYWGINSAILIFPFVLFLQRRRWLFVAITAFLIVASGKRGTAIGMVAVLLTWFLLNYLASYGLKRIWRVVLGLTVVGAGLGSLLYIAQADPNDLHPQLARAVAKWNDLVPRKQDYSLETASGGRWSEIKGALGTMGDSLPRRLWGSGFGWYFIWLEDPPPRPHHFTHVSPVNFLVTYGWLGGSLLLAVTAMTALASMVQLARRMRRAAQPVPTFLFVTCSGLAGISLTSFTLGVDPMFWIVFGMLLRCMFRPRFAAVRS